MACKFEYKGKTYDQDGLAKALEQMQPSEAHKYIDGVQNLPDMPFKKTWLELAAKRMIREAAENGSDILSWTPGEAQAARYDLSKQVEAVRAIKRPSDGNYTLAYRPKGQPDLGENSYVSMHETTVPKEKLADFVGKDLAERIIKDGGGKYSGLDLKVGGEGMHYFYDKMLPATLQKLTGQKMKVGTVKGDHDASFNEPFESRDKAVDVLKRGGEIYGVNKHGQETRLTSVQDLLDEEGQGEQFRSYILGDRQPQQPINYIDLPQSVKDTALHKGFPLFSSGLMLTPTDENPFAKSKYKLVPIDHNPFEEKK